MGAHPGVFHAPGPSLGKMIEITDKSLPPVKRVVRSGAISPLYLPAPQDAGFHFRSSLSALTSSPPLKGYLLKWVFVFFHA